MNTKTNELLPSIVIEPTTPATHAVIWLHGLGADGNDFAPFVPELSLPHQHGIRFIFPHADIIPVTVNNRYPMRAWYDILGLSIEANPDKAGIKRSVAKIERLIAHEIANGIPASRIILGGFSQGAVLAMTTGIGFSQLLAGVAAISGYLPLADELLTGTPSAALPIFLAHGTQDSVVAFSSGQLAYETLTRAGFSVEWHSYPIPHTVSDAEIKDLSKWIQARFAIG